MNMDRRHFLEIVAAGTAVALAPRSDAAESSFELDEVTVGELQEAMRAGRCTASPC